MNLNFISFESEDIPKILKPYNRKIDGYGYIVNVKNKKIKETCNTCGCDIKAENLGNILPGSDTFLCDNPNCFALYLAKEKIY